MNCIKVLPRCKAECCGPCPIPLAQYQRNLRRRARKPAFEELDDQGYMHAVDAEGRCVFNRPEDYRCAIYDDRPEVCKRFGDESHEMLTCRWQAADGRVRCRGERRQLSRKLGKGVDQFLGRVRRMVREGGGA